MDLNGIVKNEFPNFDPDKHTINPEGGLVYKEDIYRNIIMSSINLNISTNKFYFTDSEILSNFITGLDDLYKVDPTFLPSLANYLSKAVGRKLSPSVITGFLMAKDREDTLTNKETFDMMTKRIDGIFNNPKRIAEAFAMFNHITNLSIKRVPKKYKTAFKHTFENFSELTLKKNKLLRRTIKTSDLIKILRPKPKNESMSKIYKNLIENNLAIDIINNKEDQKVMTSVISSKDISTEQKKEIVKDNIDSIPINMLIRNLQFIENLDFDAIIKIYNRFNSLLDAIKNRNENVMRIFNIFDFFAISLSPIVETESFNPIKKILNEVIYEYIKYIKSLELFDTNKTNVLLCDISGSMSMDHFSKNLSTSTLTMLTTLLYIMNNPTTYVFNSHCSKAPQFNISSDKPLDEAKKLFKIYNDMIGGGTALVDAVKQIVHQIPNLDKLVIITDEVTWADNSHTTQLNNLPVKFKTLIFNPNYVSGQGVVIPDKTLLKFSALNSSTFPLLQLFNGNINNIVKIIKEKY